MYKVLNVFTTSLFILTLMGQNLRAETLSISHNNESPHIVRVILTVEDESLISSQIDGRIKKINVRDGDRFRAGETLATIDCAIYEARQKRIEAEYLAAKYNLQAQKKLKQLRTGSTIKLRNATANLAKAQADMEIIKVTLDMCSLKAPFSGLVVNRKSYIQQYVSKGEPILEIIDDSTIEAHLIVPSKWLIWLKKGAQFSFTLEETNLSYNAKVSHIGVRIDSASQTVIIKGDVQGKNPELRVGMGGYATFIQAP
ncbi:MAG: efflux RND transporter periplasmic adaptor subunit [Magnetococcales bacterium]|nr:efflux RND transporter periplasmic adaptor subunit [Magnetococcales bacterium]